MRDLRRTSVSRSSITLNRAADKGEESTIKRQGTELSRMTKKRKIPWNQRGIGLDCQANPEMITNTVHSRKPLDL